MCSHPGCRPSAQHFQLRGAAGKPPEGGWSLRDLPVGDDTIKAAWVAMNKEASGSVDAIFQAEKFLKTNGVENVRPVLEEYAVDQWCRPDPWRCRGYNPDAPLSEGPRLPWARAMWESSNEQLNDSVADTDAGATLYAIVENLTTAIEGPQGCPKCAAHWQDWTTSNPPVVHSLSDARVWLWKAHNHTRENKAPVPFEEIALKFSWH